MNFGKNIDCFTINDEMMGLLLEQLNDNGYEIEEYSNRTNTIKIDKIIKIVEIGDEETFTSYHHIDTPQKYYSLLNWAIPNE